MNRYCILTSLLTRNHPKLLQISINPACEVINQINKYIGIWRSNNDFPKIIDSHSMGDVNHHVIISFFMKTLERAMAGQVSDVLCYIVWYCTTQVYKLFSGICITQPSDEYLLKLHFVVEEPQNLSSSTGRFCLTLLIFDPQLKISYHAYFFLVIWCLFPNTHQIQCQFCWHYLKDSWK